MAECASRPLRFVGTRRDSFGSSTFSLVYMTKAFALYSSYSSGSLLNISVGINLFFGRSASSVIVVADEESTMRLSEVECKPSKEIIRK